MEPWTAFTIGLFGSLHCVGMCGPIAAALPLSRKGRLNQIGNLLLYNSGRIITYSIIGGVIGLLGKGILFAGFQRGMSLALGITLLVITLLAINVESKLLELGFINRFYLTLKGKLAGLLKKRSGSSFFSIGLLNGLLPCGLVYVAVFGALSATSVLKGMSYMAFFGLGTVPLMFASSVVGNLAGLRFRNILRKIQPVLLLLFALLFIFRGLHFHLPTDFFFWDEMQEIPMCH